MRQRYRPVAQGYALVCLLSVLQNVNDNVRLLYNARGLSFRQSNELLAQREVMIADQAAQQRLKERVEAAHADFRSGN